MIKSCEAQRVSQELLVMYNCTIQVHIPVNFLRKLLLVNSNYISVVILIELSIFDLLNPYKVTQCVYFPK